MAEEDTMVQGMMGMMMVIMMVAVLSQMIPVLAAPGEPGEPGAPTGRSVSIALRNPPSDGTMWVLSLMDWNATTLIHFVGKNGKEKFDMEEVATFEVPVGLGFPLRIARLAISKWKDGIEGGTIQHLYEVQSYLPYLWDFSKGAYGDVPDPTYVEAFLNAFGHSYYDVNLETFTAW